MEKRTAFVTADTGWLTSRKEWEGLKCIGAVHTEFEEWIKSEYGLKVSPLYVAQIKDKCGFEKCLDYNIGDNKHLVPKWRKKKILWRCLSILR